MSLPARPLPQIIFASSTVTMANSGALQSASFKDKGVCWAKEFVPAPIRIK